MDRREVICGMATGGVVGLTGCVSDLPLIGDDTPEEPEGSVEVATFYFQTDEIDGVITVVHPESERYEFLSGQTGETVPYDGLDTMVRKKKRGTSVVSLAYGTGPVIPNAEIANATW